MSTTKENALEAVRVAMGHKAEDPVVLHLGRHYVSDYFVIATVLNRRHGRAVAEAVMEEMKIRGLPAPGLEGLDDGAWVLVDFGSFVLHLFEQDFRKFYDLESLWEEAPRVPLTQPPVKKASKRARPSR